MSTDDTPVPQPNEVRRDDDEVQYHKVDETNVGDANREQEDAPASDEPSQ